MDKNSAIPCHSLHNRAKSIYCKSTTYVSIRAKILPKEGSTPSLGTISGMNGLPSVGYFLDRIYRIEEDLSHARLTLHAASALKTQRRQGR